MNEPLQSFIISSPTDIILYGVDVGGFGERFHEDIVSLMILKVNP